MVVVLIDALINHGPLLYLHRFKKKGKKWYNWSDLQAQEEWDKAVRDPSIPRTTDAFGNLCIAKLTDRVQSKGCNVATVSGLQSCSIFHAVRSCHLVISQQSVVPIELILWSHLRG